MWQLRAWLTRQDDKVTAAFVASSVADRLPAARAFESEAAARHWVEEEARFLDAAVEWVGER